MVSLSTLGVQLFEKKPKGVHVLSASQIGRWDDCQRWWAFDYIAGFRAPPHPSAVLGSKVHGLIEAWLRDATPPAIASNADETDKKALPLAKRMIHTLTEQGVYPRSGAVERPFYFRSPRGLYYTGYIDWSGLLHSMATVVDHKTTLSIEEYGKTEQDLHNDIQSVIYAVVACVGFGTEIVDLFWNYGETKEGSHETRPVRTRVHLPQMYKKFEFIEAEGVEIVSHKRAQTHPLSLPPTPQSCGLYGGCPHRGLRCRLSAAEDLAGVLWPRLKPSLKKRMQEIEDQMTNGNGNGNYMPMQPPPGYAMPPQQQAQMPLQGPPQGPPPGWGPPAQQSAQFTQPPASQPNGAMVQGGGSALPSQLFPSATPPAPAGDTPQTPQGPPSIPPLQDELPPPQQAAQPQYQQPAAQPQYQQPAQPQYQQPAQPQYQQAPQQPPATPFSSPLPPESSRVLPDSPEDIAKAEKNVEREAKKKAREALAKAKMLTLEQQVFLTGAQAALGRPDFPMNDQAASFLYEAGNALLNAFQRKFEEEG